MTERPGDHDEAILQLLGEVELLEAEQRTLDLRDPGAVERHQQKIEVVRTKIRRLNERRDSGPRALADARR